MNEDELTKRLSELATSVGGLRVEVEGWRQHTGSTGEFLILAVERLAREIQDLRGDINRKGAPA